MELAPDQFKDRARATWTAGNFDAISKIVLGVGQTVVKRTEVGPGMRVLDVACGTGNATIPAALTGADVTGLDITPKLLEDARRNASDAGVEIEWVEGDAEALPFEDGSFDRVLSTFGVMFAPRHEVAAAELARVCAPGGTIGVCSWTPDGFVGQMFRTLGSKLPPPPSYASPPPLWGAEDHVRELLEPHGIELEFERAEAVVRDDSLADFVDYFEQNFGPWQMAKAALGDDWPAARAELVALYENGNRAEPPALEVGQEYLIALGKKAG